ncbi:MAG: hypothetical protein ACE5J2_07755 [Nitrososphaerales archaeon]
MDPRARMFMIVPFVIMLVFVVDAIVGNLVREPAEITELDEQGEQRAGTSVTKPLAQLLPVQEDIGTEWRISEPTTITLNAKGFIEGIQQAFDKGPSYDRTTVTVSVYRLESHEDVSAHSSNIISSIKTEGAYEEISIQEIDADCYGAYQKLRFWDRATFYCDKDDIYFKVKSAGLVKIDNDASDFARIIASKISDGEESKQG